MASQPADTTNAGSAGATAVLRVWLNAFIPRELDGVEVVTTGPHAGKTILPSPGPVDAWFLTDQRGFSADVSAHSRMHSEFELALPSGQLVSERHRCDDTVQIDSKTGDEVCRETPDTADMAFSEFRHSAEARTWSCTLQGASQNGCMKVGPIKVSPHLDYSGVVSVMWNPDMSEITVVFDGNIETYPAFELYASVDGGAPTTIFQEPVEQGTTPMNLAGPPTRDILHQARLTR